MCACPDCKCGMYGQECVMCECKACNCDSCDCDCDCVIE